MKDKSRIPNKKNNSKLQFTLVYNTSKLCYFGTFVYYGKKPMVLYREQWNFDLRRKKKHGRLAKNKKFDSEWKKTMEIYQNN